FRATTPTGTIGNGVSGSVQTSPATPAPRPVTGQPATQVWKRSTAPSQVRKAWAEISPGNGKARGRGVPIAKAVPLTPDEVPRTEGSIAQIASTSSSSCSSSPISLLTGVPFEVL